MTTTTTTPQRTAYDVLADWVRIYWRYGIKIDGIDVFFDGYAENDEGEADKSSVCYSVYIHRRSVEDDFEIGDHGRFLHLVYTQPEDAASFYVWLDADGELDSVSDTHAESAWVEDVIMTLDAYNPVDWIADIDDYITQLGWRWVKRDALKVAD